MIPALIKGKLSSEQKNMEDILTSNVFGLLQYLPPEFGLLPFLAKARLPNGQEPLANLPKNVEVEYEFWPQLVFPGCVLCEPDVLLHLTSGNGIKHIILVEAKFKSGKSSQEDPDDARPTDQLAKEWHNLIHLARKKGAQPLLLYVTADFGFPVEEIQASCHEFEAKPPSEVSGIPFKCAWLSWRHLESTFRHSNDHMVEDLVKVVRKLGLVFFDGVSAIRPISSAIWNFRLPVIRFQWNLQIDGPISWRFGS